MSRRHVLSRALPGFAIIRRIQFASVAYILPPTDELTWTDFAPDVITGTVITVPADALTWTDFAPSLITGARGFDSGFDSGFG